MTSTNSRRKLDSPNHKKSIVKIEEVSNNNSRINKITKSKLIKTSLPILMNKISNIFLFRTVKLII